MTAVSQIVKVRHAGETYDAIKIWCPGCEALAEDGMKSGGLHMLPISGETGHHPVWKWNGDLVKVTLSPSILTRYVLEDKQFVCHSFLRDGVWEFLNDCTHSLAGQKVPMSPLPLWVLDR